MNTFLKKNLKQNVARYSEPFMGEESMEDRSFDRFTPSRMTGCGETGRSMVEMLGVLAVMGVISVGGVSAYSSAMRRHRANELINEASKRAVLVAAQAMTGKTGDISLAEFTTNTFSGVSFGETAKVENNKIILTLSGDGLESVCDQMLAATGDNSVMKVTKVGCSELTFNADLSRGVDTSSTTGGGEPPACDLSASECLSGALVEGECACAPVTGDNCPSGTTVDANYTGTDALGDGKCICTSWTTNQCGTGYYCQFSHSSASYNPTSGVCKDMNACGEKGTYGNFWMSNYGSGCSPDWWTAQSICVSRGKHMVNLSDIGCEGLMDEICSSSTLSAIRGAGLTDRFWTTAMSLDGVMGVDNNNFVGYNPSFTERGENNVLCVN